MILIDKEKLIEEVSKRKYSKASLQLILDQQEVKAISLDKPFCKMVYGDYVVYNKKWLVNHLQTEWNILQGKEYKPAIPVEWIEKYAKRTSKKCCHCATAIWEMLEDWEKENDKNSE